MTIERPPVDDVVVDTSAIIALLLDEPSAASIAARLAASGSPIMSAATLTELGIVAEARLGPDAAPGLHQLIDAAGIDVIPVDERAARRAVSSWRSFGKGRHRAGLNFGDCFAHSLAVHTDLPILCVGDDFAHTDANVVILEP